MLKAILVAIMLPVLLQAQHGSIRGTITNEEHEPIPGVNVHVEGTTLGSTSGVDGKFMITGIDEGPQRLLFSHIGFESQAVSVVVRGHDTSVVAIELKARTLPTDAIVVTANKREQSLKDVPVSISLLESRSIAYRNTVALDDALRYVPGVNLMESQVNIRGSSGYSRGAGSRVLMLLDGIPLITGDTGELNFETVPVSQIDRIEVVKGASSALYGSSALGGVINVLTKPVASDAEEVRVRLYGGLYSEPSYTAWDWGGGTRMLDGESIGYTSGFGDFGVTLFGSRMADDGYRQNDFRRRYNGFAKGSFNVSSQTTLTTTFNILHQHRGSFLFWKDLDTALVPDDAQQGDRVTSTRFFLSGQLNHVASEKASYTVRAMWFRNKWDDSIDTLTNNSLSNVVRGEFQFTWTPSNDHVVTMGVEGNTDVVTADLFGSRSGGGFAVYGQDEFSPLSRLTFTIGARYDYQDLDSLPSSSQFNPKFGISYAAGQATALRASVGRGFRTPAAAEAFIVTQAGGLDIIPNLTLVPEKSVSYEIGAAQILGFAVLDVALFQSDYWDLIEAGFISVGGVLKGQFNNVTRARIRGVEVSLQSLLFEGKVPFSVGYTYMDPRDLSVDEVLKYRPRHLLYTSAQIHAGAFTPGMDFRYISRIENIDEEFNAFVSDADERVPAYVLDLRCAVRFEAFKSPWTATLSINNILQYNYVELIANMMPPRTFILSFEAQLGGQ